MSCGCAAFSIGVCVSALAYVLARVHSHVSHVWSLTSDGRSRRLMALRLSLLSCRAHNIPDADSSLPSFSEDMLVGQKSERVCVCACMCVYVCGMSIQ